ncbi:MAG: ATP-binding cassette domain-containing protein [Phycisphaerales bacterium]|nr:ATP-binding cassette domain-containing protein [Phycisphaerales bacterium]
MSDAIVLRQINKTFGSKRAVIDLDLTVPEGSLCGFLGPNGAGKTTTIRMIMSIIFPNDGKIEVLGRKSAIESKDRIGYLPEERGLYRKMRVGSFLAYVARIKGVKSPTLSHTIKEWLDRVGLADCYKRKCEELSKGMQQKIQFLSTIIHDPDLIILDEPFSGLDPINMRLLRDLISEMHQAGKTVIFSTHVMQQAELLCDRIMMIDRGYKVLDASLDEIRAQFDPRTIIVEPIDPGADLSSLTSLAGVREAVQSNGAHELTLEPDADPAETIRRIVGSLPVRRVELRRPTLEDVFIELATSGDESAKSREDLRHALRSDAEAPHA